MKSNDAVVRLPALLAALSRHGKTLAVAESLTGGRLASAIVSVPGASASFRGGVVAYACEAKNIVLGVSAQRLGDTGPVDGVVAEEMATGVARLSTRIMGSPRRVWQVRAVQMGMRRALSG